jgi:hypothetical protein
MKALASGIAGLLLAAGVAGVVFGVMQDGGDEEVVDQLPTVSGTTATRTPGAVTETPEATPIRTANWPTHTEVEFGFTVSYPADLVVEDLTPQDGGEDVNELVLEFRSPSVDARVFAITASANVNDITLDAWAVEYGACRPESIELAVISDRNGITCTREVIEGKPNPAGLVERGGYMFLISGSISPDELARVLDGLEFDE